MITPIFKKDDILDPLNYRPISFTIPFSKILEKRLHKQITAYAENRGILTPLQFGFRLKVSAQNAILYFIETIQYEIEIGTLYMLSYMIYQKHLTRFNTKFFSRNFSCYCFRLQRYKSWIVF